ncbi:pyruvate dehydrogenase E2 component (dihydrolipoamide acetyltransferase) [Nonomuraea fuscirosea]|uniref:Dihydrolipoamide acetyltransferase component of pyruvate dehydrogenase complex n=1 Tax=Nonomuraea fuscirosea TaxID=1291556 RepID=A0A2T0N5A2_9ACTN|nr:dihydrolipoamide acetyltransferase family protein [Nonomuraea fuscirosea]PRX67536.1 pyruvate dehydrogenase E2 component (dihydrolipoamide acetyltransferase) [Nonomuraea fuscirosea]
MTATAARQVFRLPDLGEGLTEAEILEWKVSVGDTVEVDQIVVEVETAKAAVEVPVPYAGTVLALHAAPGAVLSVGLPLIEIGPPGTPTGAGDRPEAGSGAAAQYREEERAGSGNVLIGYGTGHTPATRRRRASRSMTGRPRVEQLTPERPRGGRLVGDRPSGGEHRAGPGGATEEVSAVGSQAPRVISPLVRRMARDHGIDLADVTPTGPHAVILRRDVEQAIADQDVGDRIVGDQTVGDQTVAEQAIPTHGIAARTSRPASAPAPVLDADPDDVQGFRARGLVDERVPLRGLRRAVAEKLSRSRAEIPDATTWVDVDATDLLAARDALRRSRPDLGIGLLALLARICVDGLRRFPELNSSVDTDRSEIVRYGHVNLGFAAQTERGLVVPVIRDAHLLTTAGLAAELTRLTALARAGRLSPQALTGGTFTLNNYGVFGVDGSTPIINHPEAALLGVGRIIDRPWVSGGVVTARKITQLSFTFDHRVCDGGTAGGFLRHVADCVENPAILLADL